MITNSEPTIALQSHKEDRINSSHSCLDGTIQGRGKNRKERERK